jgi:hypothetical protein
MLGGWKNPATMQRLYQQPTGESLYAAGLLRNQGQRDGRLPKPHELRTVFDEQVDSRTSRSAKSLIEPLDFGLIETEVS